MAHNVYIENPVQSDASYFGGSDARAGNNGTWSNHQWVLGNVAGGSSMTATQLARHGVKVLRQGDPDESDLIHVCWSMAADQAKGTALAGRVALNFYRCYTGAETDAPQAISYVSGGTTSFSLSDETEATCGSFSIKPEKWQSCYYAVISFQFTTVTGITQAFFNYGIGTLTDTLAIPA